LEQAQAQLQTSGRCSSSGSSEEINTEYDDSSIYIANITHIIYILHNKKERCNWVWNPRQEHPQFLSPASAINFLLQRGLYDKQTKNNQQQRINPNIYTSTKHDEDDNNKSEKRARWEANKVLLICCY
jgi:hypothetical protein